MALYTAGRSVCDARHQRRMTQQQLAKLSGVAQADISRIERGLITPTLPTLMRLVETLDARIALILNEDASTASTQPLLPAPYLPRQTPTESESPEYENGRMSQDQPKQQGDTEERTPPTKQHHDLKART
jgi:transcriptional regulator with XRE-family HTH domain